MQEVGLYLYSEGPNLGKSLFLGESNRSHVLRSPMAPELIFPEEELAVTTPRQAAATEAEPPIGGAESRGVASITGELGALEAMEQDEELGGDGAREIWERRELGLQMASDSGEDEAAHIYSGCAEIHATVRSRDFRHASGIEPLREVSSLRRLGSCAGKTEVSPYVQRCSSTHSAGSDRAVNSTDACQHALK